jgi:hypothetical protein
VAPALACAGIALVFADPRDAVAPDCEDVRR